MKTIRQKDWRGQHTEMSVRDYIIAELDRCIDREGSVEQAQAGVNALIESFGRLVQTLADKGLLTAPEVASLPRGWGSSDAKFGKEVEE